MTAGENRLRLYIFKLLTVCCGEIFMFKQELAITMMQSFTQEMETVMKKEDFDHVLWNGDFNCDFSRYATFVGIIRDFLHKIWLLAVWEDSQHSVNYTKYMWIYNLHQYWTILFAMKVFFQFHSSLMSEFYILVIIWTDTLLS